MRDWHVVSSYRCNQDGRFSQALRDLSWAARCIGLRWLHSCFFYGVCARLCLFSHCGAAARGETPGDSRRLFLWVGGGGRRCNTWFGVGFDRFCQLGVLPGAGLPVFCIFWFSASVVVPCLLLVCS